MLLRSFLISCFILAVIVQFFSCSKDSPVKPKKTLAEELQEVLDSELKTHNGKGVSAAVFIHDQNIWLGVSGVSHGSTRITKDMIFNIASVTKTFTAALVLQLMEEGKISLEDSLHKWLPDFSNVDNTITIRQLLNHTSGIFDFWDHPSLYDSLSADFTRRWTPEQTIQSFTLEPYFAPGTGYHYFNTNYILLGMIIQSVTGTNVSTEIRSRFLDPLGLNHTYSPVEEEWIGEIAHGWYDMSPEDGTLEDISTIPKTWFYSIEWTAGDIFSSANDIAK